MEQRPEEKGESSASPEAEGIDLEAELERQRRLVAESRLGMPPSEEGSSAYRFAFGLVLVAAAYALYACVLERIVP